VKRLISLLLIIASLKSFSQKTLFFKEVALPHPVEIDQVVDQWNTMQVHLKDLSSKEREFYYWVNYSRINPSRFFDSAITPLTKIYPQLTGENLESLKHDLIKSSILPLLNINDTLLKMAKKHANDITSHNAPPSHQSVNGDSFIDRFKKYSLQKCGSENISFGAGNEDPLFMLVLLYLDIGVADLGHRKTLLNPLYTETGIGVSFYKDGNIFLVEDFSCTQK
jgi:hypothetical protein